MDEHSLMLHLRPELVSPGYKNAPVVTGHTLQESFDVAKASSWPGYLGSPRLATAAMGGRIWQSFAAAATDHMIKVLDGADPSQFQRYADLLERNPIYQGWIKATTERDEQLDAKQRDWLRSERNKAKSEVRSSKSEVSFEF